MSIDEIVQSWKRSRNISPCITDLRILKKRDVTPFVVGSAQVSRTRYFILNLIGAIVWAIAFACAGFFSGEAIELFLDDIKRYELYALGALVAIAIGIWLITLIRHRRHARKLRLGKKPPETG